MITESSTRERVSLQPAWGFVPAESDWALKQLIRAVLIQAGRDAEKGDTDARAWLTSDVCAFYCDYAGVNFRAVYEWAVTSRTVEPKKRGKREQIQ